MPHEWRRTSSYGKHGQPSFRCRNCDADAGFLRFKPSDEATVGYDRKGELRVFACLSINTMDSGPMTCDEAVVEKVMRQ